MSSLFYSVIIVSGIALLYALALYKRIQRAPRGTDQMVKIQSYIREGALAFIKREYRYITIFAAILFLVIGIVLGFGEGGFLNSWLTAINFLAGALLSGLAGFFGMMAATAANGRTAAAAKDSGMNKALSIAFSGGSVMGMSVVGLCLGGITIIYMIETLILGDNPETIGEVINGFGLGASAIALFSRVGGGIYTKAADVGADLVGKIETGIPEDDPRNPAVIADNVGDNVGDVAGMGADLFESLSGSLVATIILGLTMVGSGELKFAFGDYQIGAAVYPFMIAAIGVFSTIVGSFFVHLNKNSKKPHRILNMSTYVSALITVVGTAILTSVFFDNFRFYYAIICGLVIGLLIGIITEVYTSAEYKHVKEVAKEAKTGAGTTIIAGVSLGMASTAIPVIIIVIGTIISFWITGSMYGIALASLGMLTILGNTIGVDAYGPIADNAGGIAEMAKLPEGVREITDTLDSVGNTTAAMAKGFDVGSAALTALSLFTSYAQVAGLREEGINLLSVTVVGGLLIGAMLPFLFSALAMRSVGRAAYDMIEEVRRQYREHPGIMEGTETPDYAECVSISTKAAIRQMVIPGFLAVFAPLLTGLILGKAALGGLLAGALASGVMMAIFMSNAGGAWDNAKKYIEEQGLKGTEEHKAAVVGDTVGDPFKDTAGPSINILIKLMTIISLVFAPLFGSGIF